MERKTPLYERHVACGGKMVPFAGYLLPVQYETGVVREHMAVRTACGLFDVSHMGEILLQGPDAFANAQNLVTNDCGGMADGQVRYSPMCNEAGFVLDDLLVYRLSEDSYLLVVNASNREKDFDWIASHVFGQVTCTAQSDETAQLAVQGPNALPLMAELFPPKRSRKSTTALCGSLSGRDQMPRFRTLGYTGEYRIRALLRGRGRAAALGHTASGGAAIRAHPLRARRAG